MSALDLCLPAATLFEETFAVSSSIEIALSKQQAICNLPTASIFHMDFIHLYRAYTSAGIKL